MVKVRLKPHFVASTTGLKLYFYYERQITEISCGQSSSMALSEDGKIFCWGFNGNGQLGVGNESIVAVPTLLKALEDVVITKVG